MAILVSLRSPSARADSGRMLSIIAFTRACSAGLAAATSATFAVVSGGHRHTASGNFASVSGGEGNTASGFVAVVSGGLSNTASGEFTLRRYLEDRVAGREGLHITEFDRRHTRT